MGRTIPMKMKGSLPMPRMLQYVSGVRLIIDLYDSRLWHFTIHGKRYDLRARGGAFTLHADDGTLLGRFHDWSPAVAHAREHAHTAATERLPVIPPHLRATAPR
jgi:hypothetical protein